MTDRNGRAEPVNESVAVPLVSYRSVEDDLPFVHQSRMWPLLRAGIYSLVFLGLLALVFFAISLVVAKQGWSWGMLAALMPIGVIGGLAFASIRSFVRIMRGHTKTPFQ
jgi:hypothetical protein